MSLKFTIIIPCYNAESWIETSILSALGQTYEDLEVIFVDNESTDNSLEIAKKIQKKYPSLIIDTAPNLYKYSWEEPVEKALSISTGDYFTILGADDWIIPEYISEVMKIINLDPKKIKLLQTPIRGVKADTGNPMGEIKHSYKSLEEFKTLLFERCPVTTPSMVYSKELHNKGILRWDSKNYLGAVDYDLYFNIAHHNYFIYPFPKWIGYYYRWHDNQATWGMHKEPTDYDTLIKKVWKDKWKVN